MIKTKLIIALIIPISTFAYQPLCQNYFLIGSNRSDLRTFREFNNERIRFYNENISNSSNPELQIKLINEQFKYELSLFYKSIKQISESRRATKLLKTNEKAYKSYISTKEEKLLARHISRIDIITKTLANVLNQNRIPHKVIKSTIGETKLPYKYIQLDLSQFTDQTSLKVLAKYQEMFDINEFTVDLVKNIKFGSLGFRNDIQIDIGVDGLQNILIDDILLLVAKHESKHASFAKKRILDMPSRFHTSFMSTGVTPLSDVANVGYKQLMSAEELYNFANNPFWASVRLRKVDKFTLRQKLNDFNIIHSETHRSIGVAEQTKSIVDDFKKRIKDIRNENDVSSTFTMAFLDKFRNITKNVDEAISFVLTNPTKQHVTFFYLEKEMRSVAQEYLKISNKVFTKYQKKVEIDGAPKTEKAMEEFNESLIREEAALTKDISFKFLRNAERQLNELEEAADIVISEAPLVIKKQEEFIKMFKELQKNSSESLDTPEMRQMLLEQAQIVREFGKRLQFD